MNVSEVMTEEVYIASPDETVQSAAQSMADLNTGVLPVGEGDRLIGILTDRDIATRLVAAGRDGSTTAIRDIMSPQVCYCFEDEAVEEVASKMSEWQLRRLPVLNRDNQLVGVVSSGDLAREATPEISGGALSGIAEGGSSEGASLPR